MKNKNFELFHEYQKRIVEELLEEYSSKGVTCVKDENDDDYPNLYLFINGNRLLYTMWSGEIVVTKKFYYNQYNNTIGTYYCYCKNHRPKLDYNKFAGEVKAAFKSTLNLYFDMVKHIKVQKIESKIKELKKDFE